MLYMYSYNNASSIPEPILTVNIEKKKERQEPGNFKLDYPQQVGINIEFFYKSLKLSLLISIHVSFRL